MKNEINNVQLVLKRHFEPTFKMLEELVVSCPEDLWNNDKSNIPFWKQIYHTVTGIEFWFRNPGENFVLPNFNKEVTPDLDKKSNDFLTKEEMNLYLQKMKDKAEDFFMNMNDDQLFEQNCIFDKATNCDIILMQIRHFQHHIGYCNSLLRSHDAEIIKWFGFGE